MRSLPDEGRNARLLELRADRALGLLAPAEERELHDLCGPAVSGTDEPDDHELAAAAIWLASSGASGAPLPPELRARLERSALVGLHRRKTRDLEP